MAFKLMEKNWDHQKGAYVQEWLVDSEAELSQVMSSPGDIALVAEGGKRFIMDASGEWEKCPESSGGGVASWNDLEDKPFSEEFTISSSPALEFSVNCEDEGEGAPYWDVDNVPEPEYPYPDFLVIEVDGVKYECTLHEANMGGVMYNYGNLGISGSGVDTGEPFRWFYFGGRWQFLATTPGEHSVKVFQRLEIVHKIDPKYLPTVTLDLFNNGDGTYQLGTRGVDGRVVNFDELFTLLESGNSVTVYNDNYYGVKFSCVSWGEDYVEFTGVGFDGLNIMGVWMNIKPDGSYEETARKCLTEPKE